MHGGSRDFLLPAVALGILLPSALLGQAFTPPKGSGSFATSSYYTFGRAHIIGSGDEFDIGDTNGIDVNLSFSYGVTDKLAVTGSVPFVQSQYRRPPGFPLGPHDLLSVVDDGAWYGGFQDYRVAARYNVIDGPVSVTPFFEFAAPTHDYETFGHAVPGRGLREYRVGFNAGGIAVPALPRAFIDLGYAYTHAEKLEGIRPSRSNVTLEFGYFLTRSLAVVATGAWQKSHDGVEFPIPHPNRLFLFHDQLGRGHYTHAGSSISFSLNPSVDLFASFSTTLSGKNIDRTTSIGMGTAYNFTHLRLPGLSRLGLAGKKERAAALTSR